MNKLLRLLAVTLCVMGCLLTAGCGDDIKGDWIRITQSSMDGTDKADILHIETADNGGYLYHQIRDTIGTNVEDKIQQTPPIKNREETRY